MRSTAALDDALTQLDDLDTYECDGRATDLVRVGDVEAILLSIRHTARQQEDDE